VFSVDTNTIVYISVCSLLAILVAAASSAYGTLAIVIAILALLTILLIFIINYADFLVFSLFTKMFKIRQIPAKDYYIPKSNDCVVKYVNGIYYATGYLTANVYSYVFTMEQVQQEEEEAVLSEAPNTWERIVSNVTFPFKYHILVAAEDIQQYRETLEAKRGALEYRLSKEMSASTPSQLTIEDLQRQISIVQARIDRLSSGERPLNAVMYIESTAVGVSEKEALDILSNQLSHLQTMFSGFDLNIVRVVGREALLLFRLNYFIPPREELELMLSVQK